MDFQRGREAVTSERGDKPRACSFCGGSLAPHWPSEGFWSCRECTLVTRDPARYGSTLERLYKSSWEDPGARVDETGDMDQALAERYAASLAGSLKIAGFRGLKVLDFGAGRGAMVRALKGLGADVFAVEPYGLDYLRSEGIAACATLDDLPPGLAFDGIFTSDVVEHLPAPWVEISRLRERLVDGGWLYLATPNPKGLNARISGGRWREAVKPGHIVFFTPQAMERVLAKCGFARNERLRWRLHYGRNPIRNAAQSLLQWLRLDGALRYLAWK
jgi:SAM-dependent methyltransferase